MRVTPTECCFPNCESPLSVKVRIPLCDWHLVKTYREVHALMDNGAYKMRAVDLIIEEREHEPNRLGLVYFLQFADRVKIGFTTNLRERLTAIPHDRVLATMEGRRTDEQRLHNRFQHLRIVGEWFSMGDDLMDYIAQVQAAA